MCLTALDKAYFATEAAASGMLLSKSDQDVCAFESLSDDGTSVSCSHCCKGCGFWGQPGKVWSSWTACLGFWSLPGWLCYWVRPLEGKAPSSKHLQGNYNLQLMWVSRLTSAAPWHSGKVSGESTDFSQRSLPQWDADHLPRTAWIGEAREGGRI